MKTINYGRQFIDNRDFNSIKKHLLINFQKNDALVFLGNVIGVGKESNKTLSSIIELRNMLMAKHFIKPEKIETIEKLNQYVRLKINKLSV